MLTTQISGLFQRIASSNEWAIEETARLLAQATIGEGHVLFACIDEMEVVYLAAAKSTETFRGAVRYGEDLQVGTEDRVWIISRNSNDVQALEIARRLASQNIPFAAIATEEASDENELSTLASTYIYTNLTKGILPSEDGTRIVQPHTLAVLFIYEAVKMIYDEMLVD